MLLAKGQLILKAIYGLLTSPKKRTDKFVLFAFLIFTANKSNSSVHFLGESMARQSAFGFYLTFSRPRQTIKQSKLVQQRRQQALWAYFPNIYVIHTVPPSLVYSVVVGHPAFLLLNAFQDGLLFGIMCKKLSVSFSVLFSESLNTAT